MGQAVGAMTDKSRLADAVEHTLLTAFATGTDIDRVCDEAIEYGLGGVCVHPCWIPRCRARLGSRGPRLVSVVGFPLGANTTISKAKEAAQAIHAGADELDMVLALWAFKSGDVRAAGDDIRAVVEVADGRPVKVILETGALNQEEKRRAALLAAESGARYVKTCTGFGPGQASVADVQLLRQALDPSIGIKASGGVRDRGFARELLLAGADRLGTSSGVALVSRLRRKDG